MHVRNWHIKCKLKIGIYSIIWQCGNDTCIFCKSSCQVFDKRILIFSLSMTLFFEICTTKILDFPKSCLKTICRQQRLLKSGYQNTREIS